MKRVIVESPYAGDVETNLAYVRACLRDCLLRGEAPYASHALYTQPGVLRDGAADERRHGIDAGFAWRACGDLTAFYIDLGWSPGMLEGKEDCSAKGLPFERRCLPVAWTREITAYRMARAQGCAVHIPCGAEAAPTNDWRTWRCGNCGTVPRSEVAF